MLKFISYKTFWKDSTFILKGFTAITIYSIISELWSLLSEQDYITNLSPFGIENNFIFNLTFYLSSIVLSIIFLIAIFTKSKSLFNFYFYYTVIYIPIVLFLTWLYADKSITLNIFYGFFILVMSFILFLLYKQKNYFKK